MAKNIEQLEIRTTTTGTIEIEKTDKAIVKLGEDSQKAGKQVDGLGKKSKSLAEELKKMAAAVEESTEETNKKGVAIGSLIKRYLGFAAVAMTIKGAATEYIGFDSQMRKVGATVGATAQQMEMLSTQARRLGAETVWNAKESAQAQFEFAKAGFSVNEILKATPSILNTATVGQLNLADATSITAGVLRMFALDAEKSEKVGDILAKTANSTSTSIEELGIGLSYAGTAAKAMGLDLSETSALLGTLGNVNIDGSKAGTGLRRVFAALKEEAKQQKLINIGVQLTEDGKFRNFLDILDDVREKTEGMAEAQRDSFISDIFGTQGEGIMKVLLETDKTSMNDLVASLREAEGYSEETAKKFNEGLGGSFKTLGSAASELGIALITNLEPTLTSLVNGITTVTNAASQFFRDLNEGKGYAIVLTSVIGGLVVGYGSYLTVVKAMTIAEKVKNGIMLISALGQKTMTIAMALYTGQVTFAQIATWGLNTALAVLAAPIGIVVGAIAALGIGFYLLYKKSEGFRNAVSPLIEALKKLWGWVKKFDVVGRVINKVKTLAGIGKSKKEKEELEKQTTLAGTSKETQGAVSKGENTDYLLGSGISSGESGGITAQYTHNGYYLKGTKGGGSVNKSNIYNSKNQSEKNIYSSVANTPSTPEKTFEEKILDALISIKELMATMKSESTSTNITINNSDVGEEVLKIANDLTLALSNA